MPQELIYLTNTYINEHRGLHMFVNNLIVKSGELGHNLTLKIRTLRYSVKEYIVHYN